MLTAAFVDNIVLLIINTPPCSQSPAQNPSEERRVQTLGRRQSSLHFAHGHLVLRSRTEERKTTGNRTEQIGRSDPPSATDCRLIFSNRRLPERHCNENMHAKSNGTKST